MIEPSPFAFSFCLLVRPAYGGAAQGSASIALPSTEKLIA
jgi:hypothetical protein